MKEIVVSLCVCCAPLFSHADIIYSFDDGTMNPSINNTQGITASELRPINIPGANDIVNSQPSSGYEGATGNFQYQMGQLVAGTLNLEESTYLELTLAGDIDSIIRFSAIKFGARVINDTASPTSYAIYTSADDYTFAVGEGIFTLGNSWNLYSVDSFDVSGDVSSDLTVRIYLLGADGSVRAGTFRIDDISISATSSPAVPEPATLTLAMSIISFAALLGKRFKKK